MDKYKSYVICTTPRSGSTLLCSLLEKTRVAGNPGSHFHEPSLACWLQAYNLSKDNYASGKEALAAVFSSAIEVGTGNTGLFGLRLQRHSFEFFVKKLTELYPEPHSDAGLFQAAFGKTLFIFLSRESKLDQAISRVKAEQTGLWHKRSDGTELERLAPPGDPSYDSGRIRRYMAEATASDEEWRRWFHKENVSCLRISYNDLSSEPRRVLAHLLDELGLENTIAESIEPPTAKLADDVSAAWAERFRRELRP